MLPLLLCLLAFITSGSLIPQALGQDEFAFSSKRVPRNSGLTNQVSLSPRRLFSLQGHGQELDDLTYDLMPQAQSYFIEPELPTTTSVRPMFKRRKTLRPISTAEAERKKKEFAEAATSDNPEELPTKAPFKPIRQIHNTGFAKHRPSGAQRPRTRAQTENTNQLNDNANNNYELNEIQTTTEGQFEPTPSKEVDNRNIQSGRSFQSGRRKKIDPTLAAPQIKIGRPNRFQSSRRNVKPSSSSPSETPVTETSQQESTPAPRNLRNGRPGFVLRPKPQGIESSPPSEDRALRRRKKPTTEASPTDDQSVQNTFVHGQISEAPTDRKVPSENPQPIEGSQFSANRNLGFQRRPNLRSKQPRPAEPEVSSNPEESGQPQTSESLPVSMSMRVRSGSSRALADSVHESSDTVSVVAENNQDESSPSNAESESSSDTYRPRNLSQRPSPLDKLSNRQAASRRFLTPKKAQSTTSAPAVIVSTRPGRRSPLSLQNLRNRRLGKPDVTTTEETPVESIPLETVNSTNANGSEHGKEQPQPEFDAENKNEDTDAEHGEGGDLTEPEAPKVEEAPLPKRPLLPGQRKHLMGRIPLLSKPKVVTTTSAPAHVDTTETPTCEDGKRYNKVLRKCIPPFALRSG